MATTHDFELTSICIKVHGQELTVYYRDTVQQIQNQTCHICGNPVADGFATLFEVDSISNEATVEIVKGSPLFNEAQAELRKKLYHGQTVCERARCEQMAEEQELSAA